MTEMKVTQGATAPDQKFGFSGRYGGLFVRRGAALVNGKQLAASEAAFLTEGDTVSCAGKSAFEWVLFSILKDGDVGPADHRAGIVLPKDARGAVLLRLDEVRFPPGAIAYRHVYPGDGFRVLV